MILHIDDEEVDRYAKHPMRPAKEGALLTERDITKWMEERNEMVPKVAEQLQDIGLDLVIEALKELGVAREPSIWEELGDEL